ncbi:MAG: hypothetical protein R3F54_32145 [Alphaproteobacteria bacterium]
MAKSEAGALGLADQDLEGFVVEPAEGSFETRPVDQPAELRELVSRIDDVVQPAAEQVVGTGPGEVFRGHRKSQGFEGYRHVSCNLR